MKMSGLRKNIQLFLTVNMKIKNSVCCEVNFALKDTEHEWNELLTTRLQRINQHFCITFYKYRGNHRTSPESC